MISPSPPLISPPSSVFPTHLLFLGTPLSCPIALACEVLFLPSTDLPNPCLAPWRRHCVVWSQPGSESCFASRLTTSLRRVHTNGGRSITPSVQGCQGVKGAVASSLNGQRDLSLLQGEQSRGRGHLSRRCRNLTHFPTSGPRTQSKCTGCSTEGPELAAPLPLRARTPLNDQS